MLRRISAAGRSQPDRASKGLGSLTSSVADVRTFDRPDLQGDMEVHQCRSHMAASVQEFMVMSVAFRRDSDEEHREPRFELPIPPGPNLVTARGLALIHTRIAKLEADLVATSEADRMVELRRDLRYWQARQASARPTPSADGEEVGFGSRIRYREGDGGDVVVEIVGQDEADPAHGSIAFSAPLARALMGAIPGDMIAFAGRSLEILDVGAIPEQR
jgi:transcription elongation GreA/GreB family factor